MKEVVAGIDIGGTFTKFGFVTSTGEILAETSISTDTHENVDDYQIALAEALQISLKSLEQAKLVGIGIGAPNGNINNGTIEDAANLKWKGLIPFSEKFKKYFDLPIMLTNDANAAAIGEGLYGAAKGMKDYLLITLGTGLGSGIVANGNLVYGFNGFAGEIGHTVAVASGRSCGCGRMGCLETYASASGIKRTAFELMCNSTLPSLLRKISFDDLTSSDIYEFATKGDLLALEAFNFTGKILGQRLADAVAYTTPEAIFLFGGLAKAGDILLKPVRENFEASLLSVYKNKIKILPSGLQDKNIAVLGSAALVWVGLNK